MKWTNSYRSFGLKTKRSTGLKTIEHKQQKPAVKPSPNGKVDATEPSGLSKTGASTMAFAVAAVLLLAAGAGVVLLRRRAE